MVCGSDDAAGADQGFFADLNVFQKYHVHADDGAALDQWAFHDGAVTDGAVVFDDGRRFAGVDHAIVLNAGARADPDGIVDSDPIGSPRPTRCSLRRRW